MSDYPLASSAHERRRLALQSEMLRPMTLKLLSDAGVKPGAKVIELGCGNGDVTLLIAEQLGPDGEVIAVDSDPGQIASARQRLTEAGHTQVRFEVADIQAYQATAPVDAVVGRYVLLYVSDPEGLVDRAATWLRPGGALAFLEMEFYPGMGSRIWPRPTEAAQRAIDFTADMLLQAGIQQAMAARLPSMLSRHGQVHAEAFAPVQYGAASVELPLEAVRSVMPTAARLGRSDAQQHDVDALIKAERAARDAHTVTVAPMSVAAWVRVGNGEGPATCPRG